MGWKRSYRNGQLNFVIMQKGCQRPALKRERSISLQSWAGEFGTLYWKEINEF